ncbi:MAG: hypothetical protein HOF35_07905, partial [Bacteroidetes bacterium]|nr:hypothetical protein [Bacteroidota bacterium]
LKNLKIWTEKKLIPKSPTEIAEKLLSNVRVFEQSDCLIENFELYPEKLGLPLWLAFLIRTINHHNSKESSVNQEHSEVAFYKNFLMSCKVGTDYSKLLYKWQIYLLTEIINDVAYYDEHLIPIINLHKKALSGKEVRIKEWNDQKEQLENVMNENKNHSDVTYHLRRAAFLSINEVIDIENSWTSSVEAIVDAKMKEINPTEKPKELRQTIWKDIMAELLNYLKNWD